MFCKDPNIIPRATTNKSIKEMYSSKALEISRLHEYIEKFSYLLSQKKRQIFFILRIIRRIGALFKTRKYNLDRGKWFMSHGPCEGVRDERRRQTVLWVEELGERRDCGFSWRGWTGLRPGVHGGQPGFSWYAGCQRCSASPAVPTSGLQVSKAPNGRECCRAWDWRVSILSGLQHNPLLTTHHPGLLCPGCNVDTSLVCEVKSPRAWGAVWAPG